MNDLLGGPDAGEGEAVATLPKTEARKPDRAPVNPQWVVSEALDQARENEPMTIVASEAGKRNACDM